MADYKFTEKAEDDLNDIIDYTLENWDVLQVHKYIDELEVLSQLLADNPKLGVKRDYIIHKLLSFPYESHILYYLEQTHGITIVRVLHKKMDPVKHL